MGGRQGDRETGRETGKETGKETRETGVGDMGDRQGDTCLPSVSPPSVPAGDRGRQPELTGRQAALRLNYSRMQTAV